MSFQDISIQPSIPALSCRSISLQLDRGSGHGRKSSQVVFRYLEEWLSACQVFFEPLASSARPWHSGDPSPALVSMKHSLLCASFLALALVACSRPASPPDAAEGAKGTVSSLPKPADSAPARGPIEMLARANPVSPPTAAVWRDRAWRLPVEPGAVFAFCLRNHHPKPLLLAVSIQGQNIDLGMAQPTGPLWRLDPGASRCFPDFTADPQRPMAVAWRAFEVAGDDGSQLADPDTPAMAEGSATLGEATPPLPTALWVEPATP